ncbi:MAG: alpha/beta fold hydrolase [Rhodospirillales bacterium]|nr:alpha/beta fold hydrolase [Rhodospirillales bacterium]
MAAKNSKKITFPGSQGDDLAARLDLPSGKPLGWVLFAHCFTCSKDVLAASRIAAGLTSRGFAVLRFDFTGLGSSDGDFSNTNFSSNVDDLVAAADYLKAHHQAPDVLVGHSLGGAAVLVAAGRIPGARVVATVNAPSSPAHVAERFGCSLEAIEQHGAADVTLGGRTFRIQKQFLEDIAEHSMAEAIRNLRKALIVFHAPRDEIVSIDEASRIFLSAKHPKSFVSLDGADHMLHQGEDADYVAGAIAALSSRYIAQTAEGVDSELASTAPGDVSVIETGKGMFANLVSIGGRHTLLADEPESHGGTDTGPSPYDYLLTALGACTAMTIRMYAEHKKLPLERTSVTLRHSKIHAEDCAACETKTGKVDRIEREIRIEGLLTEAQRSRLLEIADRCPVHRTLHSEVSIETKLSE